MVHKNWTGALLFQGYLKGFVIFKIQINIFETPVITKHNARCKELKDIFGTCLSAYMTIDALILMNSTVQKQ